MDDVRGRLEPVGRNAYNAILEWLADNGLYSRSAYGLSRAFIAPGVWEAYHHEADSVGLVMVLNHSHNDLSYVFDGSYGGTQRLIDRFDAEVLRPLCLEPRRLSPTQIGLFRSPRRGLRRR